MKRFIKSPEHKQCFSCGKKLSCPGGEFNDCTVWRSNGNYGSSVFDPVRENLYAEIVICDECLERKGHIVNVIHEPFRPPERTAMRFDEWKKSLKKLADSFLRSKALDRKRRAP